MNSTALFWLTFAIMLFIVIFCDLKYNMLRDESTSNPRPYSWSRVQLAWWTIIVLSSMISIVISTHQIPTLDASTLILIGITTGTTAVARLIDVSDEKNVAIPNAGMVQNQKKEGFLLDILSDGNGVSMHRMQTVIFNLVFGGWFISYVLQHFTNACADYQPITDALHTTPLACNPNQSWNFIMPVISSNNLILLGLSSATYAALKSSENTPASATAAVIQAAAAQPAATQSTAPVIVAAATNPDTGATTIIATQPIPDQPQTSTP